MRRKQGSVVESSFCIEIFGARGDDLLGVAVVNLENVSASGLETEGCEIG